MNFKFNDSRFELVEWFSYPCCVCDRTHEYEEGISSRHHKNNDKDVKDFFNACLAKAEKITGRHLMDNKVAIKVFDNVENSTFYVGYKDNTWAIGNSMNPYMNSCYTINLKTNENG